ncbi:MAG: cytochrome c biogenesis protein CcsA [Actinomycetia bacterium]|nr:cytochrome c biogenesis protein CcsA [Actinomycetes bacterium]
MTVTNPAPSPPLHTGSSGSRRLGVVTVAGLVLLVLFAFVFSPADAAQKDSVRIMYIHVPAAIVAYLAVTVTAVGSVFYLWKESEFGDLIAAASAELGALFVAINLFTGMMWGKPTWGAYWVWDARLTSTSLLFIMLLGYLAMRTSSPDPTVGSRRAAIVALLAAINVPIVHFSVDWWRSLHQSATVSRVDATLDDQMLFSLFLGMIVFTMVYAWLLMHRFRVIWLERQLAERGLDDAIAERRAEAFQESRS